MTSPSSHVPLSRDATQDPQRVKGDTITTSTSTTTTATTNTTTTNNNNNKNNNNDYNYNNKRGMPQAAWLTLALLTSCCSPWWCARASHLTLQRLQTQPPPLLDNDHAAGLAPPPEGVRPTPSKGLPVEDLLENPDHDLDPSPRDLDPRVLRRRLGGKLDERFSSVDMPPDLNDTTYVYRFKAGRPDAPRPDFLRYLRAFRLAGGGQGEGEGEDGGGEGRGGVGGRRVRLRASRKLRRRLQKAVWSFTYCPVAFSWKDLGPRFWPRWLKEGRCWNGKPCSLPPGMTCRPSASVTKDLLRWHCRSPLPPYPRRSPLPSSTAQQEKQKHQQQQHRQHQHYKRRRQCRWIPVLYPVITGCSCVC